MSLNPAKVKDMLMSNDVGDLDPEENISICSSYFKVRRADVEVLAMEIGILSYDNSWGPNKRSNRENS